VGVLGVLVMSVASIAQPYGNEWIDYNRTYYKVKTAEDGMYRLTYERMLAGGMPLAGQNPKKVKLYFRGQEIAVKISGESDGQWNAGDYIEFYGRRNDGTLDNELKKSPDIELINPYYNLYSDSVAYFIELGNSGDADGKRIQQQNLADPGNLTPMPYHWQEELGVLSNEYAAGIHYPYASTYYTFSSYVDEGEGFVGPRVTSSANRTYTIPISNVFATGPNSELTVKLVGRNSLPRNVDIGFGTDPNNLPSIRKAEFNAYETYLVEEPIATGSLTGSNAYIKLYANGNDRYSASYYALRYPQQWVMGGSTNKVFRVPQSGNVRLVSISGLPANARAFDITDTENIIEIRNTGSAGSFRAIFNSGTERTLLITTNSTENLTPTTVAFSGNPQSADYIIISHPILRQTAEGTDPVHDYANYRRSAAGGAYSVVVQNVDDLYNQFSYGEISPIAIRHYIEYVSRNQLPQYLLLLGKGLSLTHRYHRQTTWDKSNFDYVPTFGYPGTDWPYTMRLNGSGEAPAFPVGRVGARTAQEVADYLTKVMEHESISEENLWKKRILHLSGGRTQAEASTFRNYLRNFENVAENPFLGGKVNTIAKSVDAVVQRIDISQEVNQGVGLITFFGHSAPAITDIEIGYVTDPRTDYNNKGKYPTILVNGCDAGDVFLLNDYQTFGEDWLLQPDKGAINFMAHSGTGYNNLLYSYSSHFYQKAFANEDNLDLSVGKIQQRTIEAFLQSNDNNETVLAQAQQIILLGDPAVELFGRPQPDYNVTDQDLQPVALDGRPISAASDTFAIQVIARNFGKAIPDSLVLELSLEDNGVYRLLLQNKVKPIYYQDTLYLGLSMDNITQFGLNKFKLEVNAGQELNESNYNNNTAYLELLIPDGSTRNLWPYPFAIVNNQNVTLKAQATNILSEARSYSLQQSTSAVFSATNTNNYEVSARGLFQQSLVNSGADSTAYFWRTRILNPTTTEDTAWAESNYLYLPNAPLGWGQAKADQFAKNKLSGIEVTSGRNWQYQQITKVLEAKTFGRNADSHTNVEIAIDGYPYILQNVGRNCGNNTIGAIRIDGNSLDTYLGYNRTCGRAPQFVNSFGRGDIISGNNDDYNLQKYIEDIPAGDWVAIFSIGSINYSEWPTSVNQAIESLGLDPGVIPSLQRGEPLILLGKKGSPSGSAVYVRATGTDPVDDQIITLRQEISGAAGIGYIETDLIGPAKSWNDIEYTVQSQDDDTYKLQVIGVDANDQETIVLESTTAGKVDISAIPVSSYPWLKLRFEARDELGQTPPNLRFWRVGYSPQPDGVLVAGEAVGASNTISQGQVYSPQFNFINVSDYEFDQDSLGVIQKLVFDQTNQVKSDLFNVKAPAAGDTTAVQLNLSSEGQTTNAHLDLEVNPIKPSERLMVNNKLSASNFLAVSADTVKPFLDVAFDGVYINNGDIVSPTAQVTVVIHDDNRFALIQDTTGIQLFLRRACADCELEPIYMNAANARFTPATTTDNCKLEFNLNNLENGRYILEVQAADNAGNKAGKEPYAIAFEVINEKTITNFYPYPNPFSTSTRFVFTLTGSEVPSNFKIQIMTISGRVVREIFKDELGPIHIGNNVTDFAWNGTDQWGDKLANGVYLYRVIMDTPELGQWEASTRDAANAKAFKEGYGKLYILR
jgi:hypothetical protein